MNIDTHRTHCCKSHGCKYGDADCPVVSGTVIQEYPCELCYEEDYDSSGLPLKVTPGLIKTILDSSFWLRTLKSETGYTRTHDDCDGNLTEQLAVVIDTMGDIYVQALIHPRRALRFRTSGGGGRSLRVRNALLILAEAIRLDNEEEEGNDGH